MKRLLGERHHFYVPFLTLHSPKTSPFPHSPGLDFVYSYPQRPPLSQDSSCLCLTMALSLPASSICRDPHPCPILDPKALPLYCPSLLTLEICPGSSTIGGTRIIWTFCACSRWVIGSSVPLTSLCGSHISSGLGTLTTA